MAEYENDEIFEPENEQEDIIEIGETEPAPSVRTVHIATDENGVITAIADIGKLSGGFDFTGVIPDDLKPGKYMLHSETAEKAVEAETVVNQEEMDADPETEPVIGTHTETVTETVYTITENPDYAEPEPVPVPPSNGELAAENEALKNEVTDLQMALCEVYELMEGLL